MEISQWASENEGSVPLINHIRSGDEIAVIALVFVVRPRAGATSRTEW
jgi:hypothetical protein